MAKLKDSRVYGNLDIDSVLTVSSDTTINGNLTVTGNTIYSYVDTMKISDPILELGGGDNGGVPRFTHTLETGQPPRQAAYFRVGCLGGTIFENRGQVYSLRYSRG